MNEFEQEILSDDSLDFDLIEPVYEVDVYGLDENDKYTDFAKRLDTFKTEAEAISFASKYRLDQEAIEPTVYFRVEVTKVVYSGGDIYDNSEVCYSRVLLLGVK